MMFVLSVCLSICPRAFLVVLLLLFCFFLGVFPKKKWRNPKTDTHDKKKFKRGKDRKKERERHKNTRAHTRKIYIYIRARTHGYIYIYTEYNTSRSRRLETGAFYITEHT